MRERERDMTGSKTVYECQSVLEWGVTVREVKFATIY